MEYPLALYPSVGCAQLLQHFSIASQRFDLPAKLVVPKHGRRCREIHHEDGSIGAIRAELIALHADFGCWPVHAFCADRDRSQMILGLRALLQAIVLEDHGAAVWNID